MLSIYVIKPISCDSEGLSYVIVAFREYHFCFNPLYTE